MSRKKFVAHAIHDSFKHAFRCLHCGGTEDEQLPAPSSDFVKRGLAFERRHRECPPPAVTVDTKGGAK